jgi:hypothetical protein
MLQTTPPEKESKLFTGRTSSLKQINESISKSNIAVVLAPSGFGRTSLLRQFASKNNALYLDLRKISLSPENLAIEFMCAISAPGSASSIETLKQLKLGKKCDDLVSIVDNELQKIKPDQELLLKSAFTFAEEFAAEQNKKSTIILNNFDELLKLNNFSQIKDAIEIFFNSTAKNKNTSFILASAAVHIMKKQLKKHISKTIDLPPFSSEETKELFEKIAGKTDDRITKEVYRLSAGIPIIVKNIAQRFKEEKTPDIQKNIQLIKHILLSDLATTNSSSYFYCSKLFTNSLNRARGESLLKTILKAVSQNQPLRLTEIARLIYRSGPVTKSLLERLIEVDLITKTDSTFDFANPVLKQWCRLFFKNIEFNELPDEKTLEKGGLL